MAQNMERPICSAMFFEQLKRLTCPNYDNRNDRKKQAKETKVKIIDLIDDCLEPIFLMLTREDLANVAEANRRFIDKACYAFARNYAEKPFESGYDECDTNTYIQSMNVIKHFGEMITKLDLYDSHDDCDYNQNITDALFAKCNSNITDICFDQVDQHTLNKIHHPFPNLINLNIYGLTLPQKIAQLNRWFPNVTKLILRCTGIFLEQYCNLEHLIEADISIGTLENMRIFLRSNPQLQSLRLRCNNSQIVDGELFDFMAANLPNLEHLTLTINEWRPVPYRANAHFNNLRTLSISLLWDMTDDLADNPADLGITSDALEETKIRGLYMNEACVQFVSRCPNVTEAEFATYDDIDDILFIQLAANCPTLRKLQIVFISDGVDNDLDLDGLIHFIGHSRHLINVTLQCVMRFIRSYEDFCRSFTRAKRDHLIDPSWMVKQIIGPFKTVDIEITK